MVDVLVEQREAADEVKRVEVVEADAAGPCTDDKDILVGIDRSRIDEPSCRWLIIDDGKTSRLDSDGAGSNASESIVSVCQKGNLTLQSNIAKGNSGDVGGIEVTCTVGSVGKQLVIGAVFRQDNIVGVVDKVSIDGTVFSRLHVGHFIHDPDVTVLEADGGTLEEGLRSSGRGSAENLSVLLIGDVEGMQNARVVEVHAGTVHKNAVVIFDDLASLERTTAPVDLSDEHGIGWISKIEGAQDPVVHHLEVAVAGQRQCDVRLGDIREGGIAKAELAKVDDVGQIASVEESEV